MYTTTGSNSVIADVIRSMLGLKQQLAHEDNLGDDVQKKIMGASGYIRRNVTIRGHRTSISLERSIWNALEEICDREEMNFNQICTQIDHWRDGAGRTSAVRTFIVNYYKSIVDRCEMANSESTVEVPAKFKLGGDLARVFRGQM